MPSTQARRLNINVENDTPSQLEIQDPARNPGNEDYDDKLADAQHQLERLHSKRQELERQKTELEEVNQLKGEFLHSQLEITEKLSGTITAIEREVFDMRQETEDMEQTKASFAKHLRRIESLNPEAWPKESLKDELERALSQVEQAADEYEQAADYFSGDRSRGLFGPARRIGRRTGSDFQNNLRSGLAFNLPVIILGTLALLVYLLK